MWNGRSRTLIIDTQWHKKGIIPRYNKYLPSARSFIGPCWFWVHQHAVPIRFNSAARMNILSIIRLLGQWPPSAAASHNSVRLLIDSMVSNKSDNGHHRRRSLGRGCSGCQVGLQASWVMVVVSGQWVRVASVIQLFSQLNNVYPGTYLDDHIQH